MNPHLAAFENALENLRAANTWAALVEGEPDPRGDVWSISVTARNRDLAGVLQCHPVPPRLGRALAAAAANHFPTLMAEARAALLERVHTTARAAYLTAMEVLADERIRTLVTEGISPERSGVLPDQMEGEGI